MRKNIEHCLIISTKKKCNGMERNSARSNGKLEKVKEIKTAAM